MKWNNIKMVCLLIGIVFCFAACEAQTVPANADADTTISSSPKESEGVSNEASLVAAKTDASLAAESNSICVLGSSTVFSSPEIAVLCFELSVKDASAQKAEERLSSKVNVFVSKAESLKIAKTDISTGGIDIQPEYTQDISQERVLSGYSAQCDVLIAVKTSAAMGQLIDQLLKDEESVNYRTVWSPEDELSLYQNALKLAYQEAKSKADTLAGAAGKKVTGLLYAREIGQTTQAKEDDYLTVQIEAVYAVE